MQDVACELACTVRMRRNTDTISATFLSFVTTDVQSISLLAIKAVPFYCPIDNGVVDRSTTTTTTSFICMTINTYSVAKAFIN